MQRRGRYLGALLATIAVTGGATVIAASVPGTAGAKPATPAATWIQLHPAVHPTMDGPGAVMADDRATGQLVLFGGTLTTTAGGTWVWTGSAWSHLSPATSPPILVYAAMAYDTQTGQLVLFGGQVRGRSVAETWTWNGSNWADATPVTPRTSPPPTNDGSLAYDPATGHGALRGEDHIRADQYHVDVGRDRLDRRDAVDTGHKPAGPHRRLDGLRPGDRGAGPVRRGRTVVRGDTWTWGGRGGPSSTPSTPLGPLLGVHGLRPGHRRARPVRWRHSSGRRRHLGVDREHMDRAGTGHQPRRATAPTWPSTQHRGA